MKTNSPGYLRHRNPDNNPPEQTPFFSKTAEGDVPAQQSGFFSAPGAVIQREPLAGAPADAAEAPNFTPAEEPMASFPQEQTGEPNASFPPEPGMADLTPQKITLIKRLADLNWVSQCLVGLDLDAHPLHRDTMMEALMTRVLSHTIQLGAIGGQILMAGSKQELDTLGMEIDAFKAAHTGLLKKELEDVIEYHRVVEQYLVILFLNGPVITKDPTNANKSGLTSLLEYHRGMEGTVKMITRLSYKWERSPAAIAAGITDWTEAEKTQFKQRFQQQVDNVWNSRNAAAFVPFRISQPKDYLLKNSPMKWSDITAHMEGEVRDAEAGAQDFEVTITKNDPATESDRAEVGQGVAKFYETDSVAGLDPVTGAATGDQQTLAHEWTHMIGQPDEYAEDSSEQSQEWIDEGSDPNKTLGSDQWTACQNELSRRAGDPALTPAQQSQASTDLNNLTNPSADIDPVTPGVQPGMYGTANRANTTLPIPDECFAVRGAWSGPTATRLRPGGLSERGGTRISASVQDEARITDDGNAVHAYHRDGVLKELNDALSTQTTDPPVQFEHNFQDMPMNEHTEVFTARLNKIYWDIISLQERISAGASSNAPGSISEGAQSE